MKKFFLLWVMSLSFLIFSGRSEEVPDEIRKMLEPGAEEDFVSKRELRKTKKNPGKKKGIEIKVDKSKLITLDCYDADIRDVLRTLANQQGVNMITHRSVSGRISIHLSNVPFETALKAILSAYHFTYEIKDGIYVISRPDERKMLSIHATRDMLSLNVRNAEIREVLQEIAQQADISIIIDKSVSGTISGNLHGVELEEGLRMLLSSYGFTLTAGENIYRVSRAAGKVWGEKDKALSVFISGGLVSLEAQNVELETIIREIVSQAGVNYITFGKIPGQISIKVKNIPLGEVLNLVLKGTSFTCRKIDHNIYIFGSMVGKGQVPDLVSTSKLIKIKYLKAEDIPGLLPESLKGVKIKVVKQQNALLVTDSPTMIERVEDFIEEIDQPAPQVMIEALVVELSKSGSRELGIYSGKYVYYTKEFQTPATVSWEIPGTTFTYQPLGKLAPDFFLKLHAIIEDKKGKIKANPKITTLNGEEANIRIGWYTFYQTTSGTLETPVITTHRVDTGIVLKIKPFVTANGEIITQVNTSISSAPTKSKEGYPEVSETSIDTILRLKDGETMITGGLIQTEKRNVQTKIPILGSIPFLGALFRSSTTDLLEKELIISITPHILPSGEEELGEKKRQTPAVEEERGEEEKKEELQEQEESLPQEEGNEEELKK
jgi:type IV pilus assembly protein PilQ